MSSLIGQAAIPLDHETAIDASMTLLSEAKVKAPNASPKTIRRWIKIQSAKLSAFGVIPPQ